MIDGCLCVCVVCGREDVREVGTAVVAVGKVCGCGGEEGVWWCESYGGVDSRVVVGHRGVAGSTATFYGSVTRSLDRLTDIV